MGMPYAPVFHIVQRANIFLDMAAYERSAESDHHVGPEFTAFIIRHLTQSRVDTVDEQRTVKIGYSLGKHNEIGQLRKPREGLIEAAGRREKSSYYHYPARRSEVPTVFPGIAYRQILARAEHGDPAR